MHYIKPNLKLNNMKKLTSITMILISASLLVYSCKSETTTAVEMVKVTNNGEVIVENGKGIKDTINFQCTGCEENIKEISLFNKITKEASLRTKKSLNYPLSFIPKKIELTVIKEDSLFYFENNKRIEKLTFIIAKYGYIGKNSYGNELEGDAFQSFYIQDNEIVDLKDEIKLDSLYFDKYINRTLSGFDNDNGFIEFTPTKRKSIILKSSLSCVDEGSQFQIILENDTEVELSSWNDFNCEGTSYFKWFNKSQIAKLKASKVKYLYIYSEGKSVMVRLAKNKSDYFQQLIELNK